MRSDNPNAVHPNAERRTSYIKMRNVANVTRDVCKNAQKKAQNVACDNVACNVMTCDVMTCDVMSCDVMSCM